MDIKEKLLAVNKEMQDFREKMDARYKGDPEELKKLLLDALCMIYVSDYVRPREK